MKASDSKVKLFLDPESGNLAGFAGEVMVNHKSVFIDTRTGIGYEHTIKLLDKMINFFVGKFNLIGFDSEDMRQHIVVYILENIPKFDPTKNIKLSTFLQMLVKRKLINEIRDQGRGIRNPTVLSTTIYSITCKKCKHRFLYTASSKINHKEDFKTTKCEGCGKPLDSIITHAMNCPPQYISDVFYKNDSLKNSDIINEEEYMSTNGPYMSMIYGRKLELDEEVQVKLDLYKIFNSKVKDPDTLKLLNYICFEDFSVLSAANKIGISHVSAESKLKKLKRKKAIRDALGR